MLVNTYAHIQQSSRVELGKKFESGFYAKPEARSPQPAGCTRRRRTNHLYDRSAGTFEECRPQSKGAAPSGSADLMQNPTHIFKQFRPLQNLLAKITTVQKPCIDRAIPDFSGLHNKKERQILRFDVQYLVHLQGLEPWAH